MKKSRQVLQHQLSQNTNPSVSLISTKSFGKISKGTTWGHKSKEQWSFGGEKTKCEEQTALWGVSFICFFLLYFLALSQAWPWEQIRHRQQNDKKNLFFLARGLGESPWELDSLRENLVLLLVFHLFCLFLSQLVKNPNTKQNKQKHFTHKPWK